MAQQEETPCILLYYKYVEIGDQRRAVADWFREACQRLNLKGRVRIALDGVNVTVRTSTCVVAEQSSSALELCYCETRLRANCGLPALNRLRDSAC